MQKKVAVAVTTNSGDGEVPVTGKNGRKNRRGKGVRKVSTHSLNGRMTAVCGCGCGHTSHKPVDEAMGNSEGKKGLKKPQPDVTNHDHRPKHHHHKVMEKGGVYAPSRFDSKRAIAMVLHATE